MPKSEIDLTNNTRLTAYIISDDKSSNLDDRIDLYHLD